MKQYQHFEHYFLVFRLKTPYQGDTTIALRVFVSTWRCLERDNRYLNPTNLLTAQLLPVFLTH